MNVPSCGCEMSENVDPQALNPGKVSKKGCEPKRVPFSIFARATQHVANLENLVPRHGENACRLNSSMYSITGLLTHLFRGKIRGRGPIPGATFICPLLPDNCNKCFCCLLLRVGVGSSLQLVAFGAFY